MTFVDLYAIDQTQEWDHRRVDGVGRLTLAFRAGPDGLGPFYSTKIRRGPAPARTDVPPFPRCAEDNR